jgi:hypothetical protein
VCRIIEPVSEPGAAKPGTTWIVWIRPSAMSGARALRDRAAPGAEDRARPAVDRLLLRGDADPHQPGGGRGE